MKTGSCLPALPPPPGRLISSSRAHRESGGALVAALVTLAVLALIAASTFLTVTNRFRSNYQTASWHDALTSAEGGAQYALVRLRTPLTKIDSGINGGTSSPFDPLVNDQVLVNPLQRANSIQADLVSLTAQLQANGGNANGLTSNNGTVLAGVYNTNQYYARIQLPTLSIPHTGQGSSVFSSSVIIDALPTTSGASTYYRIQSTGTVPLAGTAVVGLQKYDNYLRKLQFRSDGAGNVVTTPRAVRTIEVIAKPVSIGSAALFAKTGINLNNQNVVIDSYDSRSSTTSTGGSIVNGVYQYGTYDPKKATKSANVVTDDEATSSGTPGVINLSPTGAYVYGNVATNDTPVQGSTGHVSGTVTQDFYQNLPNPPDPSTMGYTWTNFALSSFSGNTVPTMTTGTAASPTRYKIYDSGNKGSTDLSLSGNSYMNIDATGGGYVEIWIPGDLSLTGQAAINIPDGVHATFYVDGTVNIAGQGVLNPSQVPGNVTFYGNPDPSVSQSISIAGNGVFAGVMYAPNADVAAKGSGNSGDIYGAIIANTIFFNGTTSLHYDTALGDIGAVIDYRIGSWYEDNTLTPR